MEQHSRDMLAPLVDKFFIKPRRPTGDILVFGNVAGVRLERRELIAPRFELLGRQRLAVVGDQHRPCLARLGDRHVDVEQARTVVGEAAVDRDLSRRLFGNGELHRAEQDVVRNLARFALVDVEFDVRLVVRHRRIIIGAADRGRAVAADDRRKQAIAKAAVAVIFGNFDAQREGADIGEPHFVERGVARDQPGLDRRTDGDRMVGVHDMVGKAAEHLRDRLPDDRHSRRAADKNDVAQRFDAQIAVAQRTQDRIAEAREQRSRQRFELVGGNRQVELLVGEGERDLCLILVGQHAPRHVGNLEQSGIEQITPDVGRECVVCRPMRDDRIGEIVAAQPVVARRSTHFDDRVEHFDDRDVERAAAQVENEKRFAILLVGNTESERGSGGLVEQPRDLQPGELAGAPRRLALLVVEIGRDGDDRLGHLPTGRGLDIFFQAAQDDRRQIFGLERISADLDGAAGSDETLEAGDRFAGFHHPVIERRLADQGCSVGQYGNRRRRQQIAQRIGDQPRFAIFKDCRCAVGRTQIDADDHLAPEIPHDVADSPSSAFRGATCLFCNQWKVRPAINALRPSSCRCRSRLRAGPTASAPVRRRPTSPRGSPRPRLRPCPRVPRTRVRHGPGGAS
jgi:hypothetical protein